MIWYGFFLKIVRYVKQSTQKCEKSKRNDCTLHKNRIKPCKSETEEVIATLTPEESKNTNLVTDLVVPSETVLYTVLNGNVYQWDIRSMSQSNVNIGANIQSISSCVILDFSKFAIRILIFFLFSKF